MKIIVSSAYRRMERPSSTRLGTRPLKWSLVLAREAKMANISATKLNKMGIRDLLPETIRGMKVMANFCIHFNAYTALTNH